MTRIEKLEREIEQLSPEELRAFRQWFVKFEAEAWDLRFERDVEAGKLDALAQAALRAHASGNSTKL